MMKMGQGGREGESMIWKEEDVMTLVRNQTLSVKAKHAHLVLSHRQDKDFELWYGGVTLA